MITIVYSFANYKLKKKTLTNNYTERIAFINL